MTIFSCLAIIFLPPTLISGAFGMNVNVPFQTAGAAEQGGSDWLTIFNDNNGPFWTIVGVSIMISGLLLALFYKFNML